MKNLLKLLTFSLLLLSFAAAESAQTTPRVVPKQPSWAQLAPNQRKILSPLINEWDQLPDSRRERILATVSHYPKMSPEERQRYSERLVGWAKMDSEQRKIARERYKKFQSLPTEQREVIKHRWAEQHQPTKAQQDEVSPVSTPIPNAEPSAITGK